MPRRRAFACALSAGLAVAGVAVAGLAVAGTAGQAGAAVQPSAAAKPTAVTLAGSVAPFTQQAKPTGTVPSGQRLVIQLWLQSRTAAATSFAQAVATPGSPQFHRYLSPDAYAARFGPTPAAARAVERWLRGDGLTDVSADPERAYVQATGTAATIEGAFHTQLEQYAASASVNAGGGTLRANDRPVSLPAALAPLVLGVTGLDNAAPTDSVSLPAKTATTTASATATTTATTTASTTAAKTTACSSYYGQRLQAGLPKYLGRTSFPTQICGYSAKQLRAAYGATMTSTGQGQTIALIELAPPDPQDLAILQDYAKVMGLPAPSKSRFAEKSFGKPCSSTAGAADAPQLEVQLEEQMDVEAAYAMAPGARELVVAGASCGASDPVSQGLIDADQAVVDGTGHHPLASIVSNSWDSGTEGQPASETKVEHAFLLQAAAEGVGEYFASGDYPGVDAPASDPYAIAVGGTTLGIGQTGNRLFETGWSTGLLEVQKGTWVNQGDGGGGAGGGPSVLWRQPAYQRGVVPGALARDPGRTGWYRSDPDISASADPATAMAVGEFTTEPGKKPVFYLTPGAGTSEATPLVAALVADAQQGSKTPFGFLDPALYRLAGTKAFHDVLPLTAAAPALDRAVSCPAAACGAQGLLVFDVQSDDHAQGYDGQVTLKGYDTMTGLGTPDGQYFISALRALEKKS